MLHSAHKQTCWHCPSHSMAVFSPYSVVSCKESETKVPDFSGRKAVQGKEVCFLTGQWTYNRTLRNKSLFPYQLPFPPLQKENLLEAELVSTYTHIMVDNLCRAVCASNSVLH
jgi:hypothetical protein